MILSVGESSFQGKPFHEAVKILKDHVIPNQPITLKLERCDDQESSRDVASMMANLSIAPIAEVEQIPSETESELVDSDPEDPEYASDEVTDADTDVDERQMNMSLEVSDIDTTDPGKVFSALKQNFFLCN